MGFACSRQSTISHAHSGHCALAHRLRKNLAEVRLQARLSQKGGLAQRFNAVREHGQDSMASMSQVSRNAWPH